MTIVLQVLSNSRCKALGLPKAAIKLLDEELSYEKKGSHFSGQRRAGRWDGKTHLFYKTGQTFPKGLLPRVISLLEDEGYSGLVKDYRKKIIKPVSPKAIKANMLEGITLRPYQVNAAKQAVFHQGGILWLATNAGKTATAGAIIQALDLRTLFVVHKKPLLKQAREEIAEKLGTIPQEIGIIGSGRFDPKHVTIATVQSLMGKGRYRKFCQQVLRMTQVLFLDEGHHAQATTWYKLSQQCKAQYRFILSGTPFGGGQDLRVEAACGPVIARITNRELIDLGVSAKPVIRIQTVEDPELPEGLSYPEVYKAGIVENFVRNDMIAEAAVAFADTQKKTLIIIFEHAQGRGILRALEDRKTQHSIEFVHGKMPQAWVEAALARMKASELDILIASSIFDEGIDIPSVGALIIGDGGKSLRATLQKVGRSLRAKKKGKNVVDILDFGDITHRWLAGHSLERLAIYEAEGFEVHTD